MSEKMAEKKKRELELLAQHEEEEARDIEDVKDDACPHCLQAVSKMPYVNFHPVMGWLECAACGIVFSPRSIRKQKLKKANTTVTAPGLLVPKGVIK